jgi:hypothetical protein
MSVTERLVPSVATRVLIAIHTFRIAEKGLSPLSIFVFWESLTALGRTQFEKPWFGPMIRDLINIHDFLTIRTNRMHFLLSIYLKN